MGANVGTNPTCAVGLPGDRVAFAYFTKTPDTVATTYYQTDAIGSVRALSDQTGATVIRHDYRPFGEDTQPLAGDPMRFAGKELDPESALMNFEARYYRNTWGRFTQVDPIAGTPADPQSWNRYAYARNNPLRFVDPSGLSSECATNVCVNVFGDLETVPGHASTPRFVGGGSSGQVLHFDSSSGLGIPMGWCADGSEGGIIYGQMYQCGGSPEQYDTPSFQKGGGGTPKTPTTPTTDTPTDTPTNPTAGPAPTDSGEHRQAFFEYLLWKPCVLSWILPLAPGPGVYGVGPAGSFSWNPETRNACASVGLGISAGHNVAIGPLTYVDGRADSVLDGMSASLGLNLPFPPVAGIGGQVTFGASGVAAGATAGVPGASGSVTWSSCTNRGQ
jgi:RHS repeat-associated protein